MEKKTVTTPQQACNCSIVHWELSPETAKRVHIQFLRITQRQRIAAASWWRRLVCKIFGHTAGWYTWVDLEEYRSFSECGRCCRSIMSDDWIAGGWQIDHVAEREIINRKQV